MILKIVLFILITVILTGLLAAIQQKIAGLGHDTPKAKAKNEVYDKLPSCCKYDRTGKTVKAH